MGRSLANGRFEVLRLLGEGGMGVVHAARDMERGEVVAVKSLRHLGGEALLRFKHEFRALQDLQHPNLVALGELVEEDDDWFYTMELVEGVDVLAWIDGDRERLRDVLRQLAAGLGALHATGKVHRDIKPSNVLVTHAGRVVLVDFGLVTESRAAVASDPSIVGTAAYMAPEQAASRPVGPAADWYAVGCILFEALTGRLPFEGTTIEILMHKLEVEAPLPSQLASVPADLDALCGELLRRDADQRPRADEVLRALRADQPRAQGTLPPQGTVFVGREAELEALERAFAEASDRVVTVLVHGESGVGKSALVRTFVDRLQRERDDVIVLHGRCYEREAVRYKAVDGVIDALSRHLVKRTRAEVEELVPPHADVLLQVFPVLARVEALAVVAPATDAPDPAERRRRLLSALRDLFTRLARRGRVVIAIDDLQWADADGLAALRELTHTPAQPGGGGMLVIGTGRTPACDQGALRDVRHVRLGPLTETSSRELAEMLARAAGLTRVDPGAIAAEAAGHPLFLDELVRRAAEPDAPGDMALDETVRARIARAPADARRVVTLLAVAGAPIAHDVLARAADLDLATYLRALDVLRQQRFARSSGTRRTDPAEIAHDRIAAAVVSGLDASAQQALHLRLATALAALPDADSEALALHWAGAGEPGRAAIHARVAADDAAHELAFERAARLYMQVLEHGGGEDDPKLYVRLAQALVGAGRAAEAAGAYLAAAQLSNPDERTTLELEAADQMLRSGHVEEGLEIIQRVLPSLGMSYPKSQTSAVLSVAWRRARVRMRGLGYRPKDARDVPPQVMRRLDACWMVSVGLGVVDPMRGADFQARHLLLALDTGEPRRVARSLAAEAAFAATNGKRASERIEKLLTDAAELAARHDDPYGRAWTMAAGGIAAFLLGRWREARERCEQAERELRASCVGASWEISTTQIFGFRARVQLGELRGLDAHLEQLVSEARARGDLLAPSHLLGGHAHVVALAADDPERARRDSRDSLSRWARSGYRVPHAFDLWAMTQTDLYIGDAAMAWKRVEDGWPALRASRLMRVELIRLFMTNTRARAAIAAASQGIDVARTVKIATEAAALLEREPARWARPYAAMVRAGLAGVTGDQAERARLLAVAADGFASGDMVLASISARLRRGVALGGAEGAAQKALAIAELRDRTVKQPEKLAAMLAP
ncbi:MAG TPA: AAA family ATPase [Kofleriaceae bacterium]|nr:AAA family ATPase [Kofleriaceae bacterium]